VGGRRDDARSGGHGAGGRRRQERIPESVVGVRVGVDVTQGRRGAAPGRRREPGRIERRRGDVLGPESCGVRRGLGVGGGGHRRSRGQRGQLRQGGHAGQKGRGRRGLAARRRLQRPLVKLVNFVRAERGAEAGADAVGHARVILARLARVLKSKEKEKKGGQPKKKKAGVASLGCTVCTASTWCKRSSALVAEEGRLRSSGEAPGRGKGGR